MASIQAKTVNGKKYWQIVQSRRVNGKPRPIVIEHLGTADTLLKKLNQRNAVRVKSYSHGLVSLLLQISKDLNVVEILNTYVQAQRDYFSVKPLANNITVGATLLLAAIGRIAHPTSKRSWRKWANKTSLSYLMRMSFAKIDSQHFWDMMDSFPVDQIENAERDLLCIITQQYQINTDNLFYDTTNFYTYIATTNTRCTIAQRGKNKQKRADLRQVGLAMVVSKDDFVPLFHESYQGNMNDAPVFKKMIIKIKKRMIDLGINPDTQTIVFDRGCNSKKNLELISSLNMFYVGALTPAHHLQLIADAPQAYETVSVDNKVLQVYRDKRDIWGEKRTVLVFVSDNLKEGQLRGMYKQLQRQIDALKEFQNNRTKPRARKYIKKELANKLDTMIKLSGRLNGVLEYTITKEQNGYYLFSYAINQAKLTAYEDALGFRIIMTNRHTWSSSQIIKSYYGQSFVENAFKNIKNPFHLALTPGHHWTDQKIKVHFFTCVLGFSLAMLLWKQAREQMNYQGNLDNLLDSLNDIRLTTIVGKSIKKGNFKVTYQLEELDEKEELLVNALNMTNLHKKPLKIPGVSVYK